MKNQTEVVRIGLLNAVLVLSSGVLVFGILYFGQNIFVPLISAALVTFLMMPLVQRMERWVGTAASAVASVTVLIAVIALLVLWVVLVNVTAFSQDLPQIQNTLSEYSKVLQQEMQRLFDVPVEQYLSVLTQWLPTSVGMATQITYRVATTVIYALGTCVFFVFYVIFFILYRHRFLQFLLASFSLDQHDTVRSVVYRINDTLSSYLAAIVTVISILVIYNAIALHLLHVPYATLWAIIGGILYIIPYIGITIGAIFPALATLALQQSIIKACIVIAVFIGNQVIENNILTPYIVGGHVRINPLFALIAVFVGGQLWGISGMILFLPMLAVIKVICDHVPSLSAFGYLLGTDSESRKKDAV